MVRKSSSSAHAHARHDCDQHSGRGWGCRDQHFSDRRWTRGLCRSAGGGVWTVLCCGVHRRLEFSEQSRCSPSRSLVLAGEPSHPPDIEGLVAAGYIAKEHISTVLLLGAAGGLLLGVFAHGYIAILSHIPGIAEMLRKSQEQITKMPGFRTSLAVIAVGFAPFAEEYLFRGLLFR